MTALEVIDFAPGRGATALWASPDGSTVAAERIFVGETVAAAIEVIERGSGDVIAKVRGSVVAGPDDLGEVIYVDASDRARPVLRSTARADLALVLAPAIGDWARWSGVRLGATRERVIVLREEVGAWALAVVSLASGAIEATRTIATAELAVRATAASPTRDALYLSGGGAVLAIDGVTLRDQWRAPWPSGHNFDQRPALGVTGDGGWVAASAPSGLLVLDADGGGDARMVRFDGHDPVTLVGVPGRPVLVALRRFAARGESPSYAIDAIELPGGAVTTLRPDRGPSDLPAITVAGDVVIVGPGAPPRQPGDAVP